MLHAAICERLTPYLGSRGAPSEELDALLLQLHQLLRGVKQQARAVPAYLETLETFCVQHGGKNAHRGQRSARCDAAAGDRVPLNVSAVVDRLRQVRVTCTVACCADEERGE